VVVVVTVLAAVKAACAAARGLAPQHCCASSRTGMAAAVAAAADFVNIVVPWSRLVVAVVVGKSREKKRYPNSARASCALQCKVDGQGIQLATRFECARNVGDGRP
jgi:hypothetical protein